MEHGDCREAPFPAGFASFLRPLHCGDALFEAFGPELEAFGPEPPFSGAERFQNSLMGGKTQANVQKIGVRAFVSDLPGKNVFLQVMDSNRQQKINRLLQRELGEIFRGRMQPFFPGIMMTVTFVRITPDLSVARVNLSFFPDKDKEGTLREVKSRTAEIRGLLGEKVKHQLRIIPRLEFFIDDSLDRVERIEALLAR